MLHTHLILLKAQPVSEYRSQKLNHIFVNPSEPAEINTNKKAEQSQR